MRYDLRVWVMQTGSGALLLYPLHLGRVQVLGKMPNKTFKFQRQQPVHQAFSVPEVQMFNTLLL